ncbi:MAG: hypothetical protein MJ247_01315 [Alphaproteobacteria bacterium]|nr:hypothetical protein [Alphaproteobacteria bacterium]
MRRILYVIILALIAIPALAEEPTKEEITPPIIIHLKDMLNKDKDDDLPYKSKFDIQKADESLRKYDLSIVEISGSDNEKDKSKVDWEQLSRLDNKKKVLMAEPLVSF